LKKQKEKDFHNALSVVCEQAQIWHPRRIALAYMTAWVYVFVRFCWGVWRCLFDWWTHRNSRLFSMQKQTTDLTIGEAFKKDCEKG